MQALASFRSFGRRRGRANPETRKGFIVWGRMRAELVVVRSIRGDRFSGGGASVRGWEGGTPLPYP
jgi:hypothetical protein